MRLRDIDPDILETDSPLGFSYDLLEEVEGIEDLYSRARTDASYRVYSAEIRQYLRQYLISVILRSCAHSKLKREHRIIAQRLERRDRLAFAALLRVDPEQVVYSYDYEDDTAVYLITRYSDRVGHGIPLPDGATLHSVSALNNVTYYSHKIK
jgi:hypothetical protein